MLLSLLHGRVQQLGACQRKMLLLGRVAVYVLRVLLQRRRSQQRRLSQAQALLSLRDWGGCLGDELARNAITSDSFGE